MLKPTSLLFIRFNASVAQNSYGLKIMGWVAFAFGLLFLIEFISAFQEKGKKDNYKLIELVCLLILSVILGLRVFYIHFPNVELLFAGAGLLLVLVFLRKMIIHFRQLRPKNRLLATLVLIFHLSIILFLLSLVFTTFSPKIGELAGAGAFVLLLGFIATAFFKKDLMLDGENISAFKMVTQFKDHSIIIISFFLLFALYIGFNRIGLLPGIYSDEFPQAYYELVDKAASKKEKPVDGKYKYEEFKMKYDQFLKHNNIK